MEKSDGKTVRIIALVLVVLCLIAAVIYRLFSVEYTAKFTAMNTNVSLSLRGIGASGAVDDIKDFINDYSENVISRHNDGSVVSGINADRGGEVPDEIGRYMSTLINISEDSGGAFDFTLGAVSDLWGFGTADARVPDEAELRETLAGCGMDKIAYENNTLTLSDDAVLDLGAAGKGMGLDEIKRRFLDGSHISRAVVSLGGSILLYGDDEFTVGIQYPDGKTGYVAVLTLPACYVSTSGSYERYFTEDGKRYHHILDPETGYPADNGLVSVTVVSYDSGTVTDALSTACFVLGIEDSRALLEKYDCEAVFIDEDGNVTVTDGLEDAIEIEDSNYTLR